jgi:hypothetical protein
MLNGCWNPDLEAMKRCGIVHLCEVRKKESIGREKEPAVLTRYRLMNWSMFGTSSPTSFNMVLYCDNSRVHAGEYLVVSRS